MYNAKGESSAVKTIRRTLSEAFKLLEPDAREINGASIRIVVPGSSSKSFVEATPYALHDDFGVGIGPEINILVRGIVTGVYSAKEGKPRNRVLKPRWNGGNPVPPTPEKVADVMTAMYEKVVEAHEAYDKAVEVRDRTQATLNECLDCTKGSGWYLRVCPGNPETVRVHLDLTLPVEEALRLGRTLRDFDTERES